MIRISALGSGDENSCSLSASTSKLNGQLTKEAQEEELFSQYNSALELIKRGDREQAKVALYKVLDHPIIKQIINEDSPAAGIADQHQLLCYSSYKNLASLHQQDEQNSQALLLLVQAVEIDSSDVSVWCKVGQLATEEVKFPLAQYAFSQGLQRNERHWPCLDKIISLTFALGNYTECLLYISRALQRDPGYVKGLAFMQRIYADSPSLQSDTVHLFGECEASIFDTVIDDDECEEFIEETNRLRHKQQEYFKRPELPVASFPRSFTQYKWLDLGHCLLALYDQMDEAVQARSAAYDPTVSLFGCKVDLSPYLNLNPDTAPTEGLPNSGAEDNPLVAEQLDSMQHIPPKQTSNTCELSADQAANSRSPQGVSDSQIKSDVTATASHENAFPQISASAPATLAVPTTSLETPLLGVASPDAVKATTAGVVAVLAPSLPVTPLLSLVLTSTPSLGSSLPGTPVDTGHVTPGYGTESDLDQEMAELLGVEDPELRGSFVATEMGGGDRPALMRAGQKRKKPRKEDDAWYGGKRRSSRVRNVVRKKEEEAVKETVNYQLMLSKFLPSSLMLGRGEPEEEGAGDRAEELMDTQSADSTVLATPSAPPTAEQPLPTAVGVAGGRQKRLGGREESENVREFVARFQENSGVIELLGEWCMAVAEQALLQWPSGLKDLYLKCFERTRKHLILPDYLCKDYPDERIVSMAQMCLVFIELRVDHMTSKQDSVMLSPMSASRKVPPVSRDAREASEWQQLCNDLHYLVGLSCLSTVLAHQWRQFALRVFMVRAKLMILDNNLDTAIDSYYQALDHLQMTEPGTEASSSGGITLYLPNLTCEPHISPSAQFSHVVLNSLHRPSNDKALFMFDSAAARQLEALLGPGRGVVEQQLAGLERCQALDEVHRLHEAGQYERVVTLLLATFRQAHPLVETVDRHQQFLLLQDCLVRLEDWPRCLLWGEVSLHEAYRGYTGAKSKDVKQDWVATVLELLDAIETCLQKDEASLDKLPSKNLVRMTQTILAMLECVLEAVEGGASELPITSSMPWILLYRLVRHEERRLSLASDDLPASFLLLNFAHEYLGRRGLCSQEDGSLLLFMVSELTTELQSAVDEPHPQKEDLEVAIGQCFYCLYGYPHKRARAKHLQDHNANQIELSWERAIEVFNYFKPKQIPDFDSLRTNTVSAELENLLRRIVDVIPQDNYSGNTVESVTAYIEGSSSQEPALPEGKQIDVPVVQEIYYLLADYYFKNKETGKAIKFYLQDLCVNPERLDSWAGMALARSSRLEQRLNSHELKNDPATVQKQGHAALRCFARALAIDTSNAKLCIEQGSLAYQLHAYLSRTLKQTGLFPLSEEVQSLTQRNKTEMLRVALESYERAERCERPLQEPWLQNYMLGKISEKLGREPPVYLEYYKKAAQYLFEERAKYPKKIAYILSPPFLSVEAVEVFYRLHVCTLKFLLRHEADILTLSEQKSTHSEIIAIEATDLTASQGEGNPNSKSQAKDSKGEATDLTASQGEGNPNSKSQAKDSKGEATDLTASQGEGNPNSKYQAKDSKGEATDLTASKGEGNPNSKSQAKQVPSQLSDDSCEGTKSEVSPDVKARLEETWFYLAAFKNYVVESFSTPFSLGQEKEKPKLKMPEKDSSAVITSSVKTPTRASRLDHTYSNCMMGTSGDVSALQSQEETSMDTSVDDGHVACVESNFNSQTSCIESTFNSQTSGVDSTLNIQTSCIDSTFNSPASCLDSTLASQVSSPHEGSAWEVVDAAGSSAGDGGGKNGIGINNSPAKTPRDDGDTVIHDSVETAGKGSETYARNPSTIVDIKGDKEDSVICSDSMKDLVHTTTAANDSDNTTSAATLKREGSCGFKTTIEDMPEAKADSQHSSAQSNTQSTEPIKTLSKDDNKVNVNSAESTVDHGPCSLPHAESFGFTPAVVEHEEPRTYEPHRTVAVDSGRTGQASKNQRLSFSVDFILSSPAKSADTALDAGSKTGITNQPEPMDAGDVSTHKSDEGNKLAISEPDAVVSQPQTATETAVMQMNTQASPADQVLSVSQVKPSSTDADISMIQTQAKTTVPRALDTSHEQASEARSSLDTTLTLDITQESVGEGAETPSLFTTTSGASTPRNISVVSEVDVTEAMEHVEVSKQEGSASKPQDPTATQNEPDELPATQSSKPVAESETSMSQEGVTTTVCGVASPDTKPMDVVASTPVGGQDEMAALEAIENIARSIQNQKKQVTVETMNCRDSETKNHTPEDPGTKKEYDFTALSALQTLAEELEEKKDVDSKTDNTSVVNMETEVNQQLTTATTTETKLAVSTAQTSIPESTKPLTKQSVDSTDELENLNVIMSLLDKTLHETKTAVKEENNILMETKEDGAMNSGSVSGNNDSSDRKTNRDDSAKDCASKEKPENEAMETQEINVGIGSRSPRTSCATEQQDGETSNKTHQSKQEISIPTNEVNIDSTQQNNIPTHEVESCDHKNVTSASQDDPKPPASHETKLSATQQQVQLLSHAAGAPPPLRSLLREVMERSMAGLALCLSRFPQHYKSLYRLACIYSRSVLFKDVGKTRDLLLGNKEHGWQELSHMPCPGLFQERKNNNFFQGLWRIPVEDIDRSGSFATHLVKCVGLVFETLQAIMDHKTLYQMHVQFSRTPDMGKKYLRDSERVLLSQQAFDVCFEVIADWVPLLRLTDDAEERDKFLLDVYKFWQHGVRHQLSVKRINAVFTDVFNACATPQATATSATATPLERAMKYCQMLTQTFAQRKAEEPKQARALEMAAAAPESMMSSQQSSQNCLSSMNTSLLTSPTQTLTSQGLNQSKSTLQESCQMSASPALSQHISKNTSPGSQNVRSPGQSLSTVTSPGSSEASAAVRLTGQSQASSVTVSPNQRRHDSSYGFSPATSSQYSTFGSPTSSHMGTNTSSPVQSEAGPGHKYTSPGQSICLSGSISPGSSATTQKYSSILKPVTSLCGQAAVTAMPSRSGHNAKSTVVSAVKDSVRAGSSVAEGEVQRALKKALARVGGLEGARSGAALPGSSFSSKSEPLYTSLLYPNRNPKSSIGAMQKSSESTKKSPDNVRAYSPPDIVAQASLKAKKPSVLPVAKSSAQRTPAQIAAYESLIKNMMKVQHPGTSSKPGPTLTKSVAQHSQGIQRKPPLQTGHGAKSQAQTHTGHTSGPKIHKKVEQKGMLPQLGSCRPYLSPWLANTHATIDDSEDEENDDVIVLSSSDDD